MKLWSEKDMSQMETFGSLWLFSSESAISRAMSAGMLRTCFSLAKKDRVMRSKLISSYFAQTKRRAQRLADTLHK